MQPFRTPLFIGLLLFAAPHAVQASGDYSACAPGNYNADQCTRAHAKDGGVDLMDIANHALAAGDKVAAFGAWSLAARSDKNPVAMYQIGAAFYNGEGAPQSDKAAAEWFQQSAELGNADAQYMIGGLYANGQGVAQNDALAMTWYQKAADQNVPEAMHNLGYFYYQGTSVAQDYERVANLWRQAAEAGYAPSYTNYGHLLYTGKGVEIDYDAAALWTRKGVTAGDAYAKSNLGEMYEYGRGVPRDIKLAEKWYREGVAAGIKDAEEGLARIAAMGAEPDAAKKPSTTGAGADQTSMVALANEVLRNGDVAGGIQILTSAAAEGDFDAQVGLGLVYAGMSNGALPRDFELARLWFSKAASQKSKARAVGLDNKLAEIGGQIRDGLHAETDIVSLFDGVEATPEEKKDYAEAILWFELAGSLGHLDSLIIAGDLLGIGGHGLNQDYVAALKYYNRAEKIESTPHVAQRIGSHYAKGLGVNQNDAIASKWFRQSADEYPEAALWLALYDIRRNELRSAMYWLDRLYLEEASTKALATQYDKALHLYYEAMLPPPPAGWTSEIQHQITPKPVSAAHFSASDIAYPITFQGIYKNASSGREYVVSVILSNFAYAAKTKKETAEARVIAEGARQKLSSKNSAGVNDFHLNISEMHLRFGAFEAFSARTKGGDNIEALIRIAINAHITLRAQTVNGDAKNPEEVESLKAALRATNLDLIKTAADGHGYYKKDADGVMYKP